MGSKYDSNYSSTLDRREKIVEHYRDGKIKKNYSGYNYVIYDSFGRMIERYGNNMFSDDSTNFRSVLSFDIPNKIIVKEYIFDDENKECVVYDTSDYHMVVYSYDSIDINQVNKLEVYKPLKENGVVIGHKLTLVDSVKGPNVILHFIPNYLRK